MIENQLLYPGGMPPVLRDMRGSPKIYIRFGNYYSECTEHSLNWATGDYERGTSVYPAEIIDGCASILKNWHEEIKDSYERLKDRNIWVLTGKHLCEGSDGEPVLQTSSIVARKLPVSLDVRLLVDLVE